MIQHELLRDRGILILKPEGALRAEDFTDGDRPLPRPPPRAGEGWGGGGTQRLPSAITGN